jgi:Xaa-Pro aminopeptidase
VIDARSPQLLQEGMVLSIEMEFRHEEAGHVKLEDMAVITGGGSELLGPRQEAWYISEG